MEENLHTTFKNKLEGLYGIFEPLTSKFGNDSFGKISSDLCISSSQFSKLISGSATEGMYIRSITNIKQLKEHQILLETEKQLKEELCKIKDSIKAPEKSKQKKGVPLVLALLVLFVTFALGYYLTNNKLEQNEEATKTNTEHPLQSFFTDDQNKTVTLGFLNEKEVQEYAPGSAFEGKWKLKEPYKIPLPGSKKPGIYLLAKSADVIMMCSKFTSNKGNVLLGFEHLTHEIWVDNNHLPLIPKYFNRQEKKFTTAYDNLDFENTPNFVKIAVIKSFYLDEFTITTDSINRKGQASGRYIDFINQSLAKKYDINIDYILNEVISDLTKTKCNSIANKYNNPNNLKKHSTLSFDCTYSIDLENLGLGGGYPYTKTLELVEQNYSDNLIWK
jgi:hypothetical protein